MTTIEMLVALSLLGLLLMVLSGGLRFGTAVWQRGKMIQEDLTEIYDLDRVLRTRIGHAIPFPLNRQKSDSEIAFAGHSGQLDFVGPAVLADQTTVYYRHRLRLEEVVGQSSHLVLWTWPLDPAGRNYREDLDGHRSVILDDVTSFELVYWDGSNAPSWKKAWQGEKNLPELVKVKLKMKQEPEPIELVLAIQNGGKR